MFSNSCFEVFTKARKEAATDEKKGKKEKLHLNKKKLHSNNKHQILIQETIKPEMGQHVGVSILTFFIFD